ncbi:DUF6148 family protein [Paenibacillus pabuli]|uniref:DUF6148 family protein n=1 Tax=Paenibacillus pabuli TaxID=1472 RepID=UPI0009A29E6F|nr:DUF6148 family protein [Paenibacillus pabuli]OPG98437.1 hypothetical protein B2I21_08790 [Chryseobacterium mucoviscidosis]UPK45882.1 hypothetical protein KET34_10695 [Paenibacillus pabuli]
MPLFTIQEARENYKIWLEAQQAQAAGIQYSVAGRSVTRIPLSEINKMVKYWGDMVDQLEGRRKKSKTRLFTPYDL